MDLVDGEESEPPTECNKRSTYVFEENQKAVEDFYGNTESGGCIQEGGTGVWKKNDDGTYSGTFTDEDNDAFSRDFKISGGKLLIDFEDDEKILTEVHTK